MINAEHAQKIMSLYESDYDDFLKGLKKKAKDKKADAAKADSTAKQAEQHKGAHLKEKAKNLLDKAGGIQGVASTISNVAKYFKPNAAPSDYAVNFGQDNPEADKPKAKVPVVVWYAGGAVLLLAGIYAFTQMSKPKTPQFAPAFVPPAPAYQ